MSILSFPAPPVWSLVTLPDVIAHLQIGKTPADGGALLQHYIDGAQIVVEDIVGHVVPASFTETHDGGDRTIYLRELPVLSVDSLIEVVGFIPYTLTSQPVGHARDNFGFTLDDPAIGRITRRSAGSSPFPFYNNVGNITVQYTAGRTAVPPNVRLGALELIAHMWRFGHQAYGPSNAFVPIVAMDESEQYSASPSGYLVPNRVKELLQPTLRPVVFA